MWCRVGGSCGPEPPAAFNAAPATACDDVSVVGVAPLLLSLLLLLLALDLDA
jgi:hypothetical protein